MVGTTRGKAPSPAARRQVILAAMRLTDGLGRYALTFILVRRRDLAEVASGFAGETDADDPLHEFSIVAKVSGFPIAEPGTYDIQLRANERVVHSLSLDVRAI